MKKITVLIADDHEIVRTGLAAVFGFQDDFTVVGEATDGEQAVVQALELKPDVVIMDLMMPVKDGVEAAREILAAHPETRVVILTTFATSALIIDAIEAGASGAISKDTPNADLLADIRRVAAGEQVLSSDIRDLVQAEESAKLTKRQQEILRHIAKGLSNLDIANVLGISEDGVKFHLRSLFTKIGAANRTEAVAIALREHLLKI